MVAKSMLSVPEAYIGTNKNRLKIYDDKVVFLENGEEFQFEIKNPTSDVIGVNIWINGELSSNSQLVLRPGESTWLDRHIDSPKKYLFDTYEVEDSEENNKAIKDNGKIKFEFYKQKPKRDLLFGNSGTITWTSPPNYDGIYWTDYSSTFNTSNVTYGSNSSTFTSEVNCNYSTTGNTKETGRVEEGSKSDQQFSNVYYDFELLPFKTIEYQILPLSQKNAVTASEIRRYCTNCRTRIKRSNWKYCPTCGEEL